VVNPAEAIEGGEIPMLGFETLTLAPIDRRLIEPSMLSEAETRWLNDYHARVLAIHEQCLNEEEAGWLRQACAPIGS